MAPFILTEHEPRTCHHIAKEIRPVKDLLPQHMIEMFTSQHHLSDEDQLRGRISSTRFDVVLIARRYLLLVEARCHQVELSRGLARKGLGVE